MSKKEKAKKSEDVKAEMPETDEKAENTECTEKCDDVNPL